MPNITPPDSVRVSTAANAALERNRAGVSSFLSHHWRAVDAAPDGRVVVTDYPLANDERVYITTDTDGNTYVQAEDEWTPPGE